MFDSWNTVVQILTSAINFVEKTIEQHKDEFTLNPDIKGIFKGQRSTSHFFLTTAGFL